MDVDDGNVVMSVCVLWNFVGGGGGGGGRHVLHLLASSCSCLMCIGSFAGATRPETFEADEAALFSHHCCGHSGLVSGRTPPPLSAADTVAATHEGDHMTDECLPGPSQPPFVPASGTL